MRSRVLFVSPHHDDAILLSRMIGSLSVALDHVPDLAHARAALLEEHYQVVLTEASLPDGKWIDVLNMVRQQALAGSEVIVTDSRADARFWAEALNLGAYDLIAQPFAASEVQRILANACTRLEPRAQVAHAAL
ncbi:MAG TPA: response regulator [Bryobacteraceae bacterium]|nr:response regulator [Bryobacteraceae bacterium]